MYTSTTGLAFIILCTNISRRRRLWGHSVQWCVWYNIYSCTRDKRQNISYPGGARVCGGVLAGRRRGAGERRHEDVAARGCKSRTLARDTVCLANQAWMFTGWINTFAGYICIYHTHTPNYYNTIRVRIHSKPSIARSSGTSRYTDIYTRSILLSYCLLTNAYTCYL